jgi:hypothetical protein
MSRLTSGIIGDALRFILENEIEKAKQLLDEKLEQMQKADYSSRRKSIDEINQSIVQLTIEIKQIEIQYQLIKKTSPTAVLHSIDEYLNILKKQRTTLEIEKKRLSC